MRMMARRWIGWGGVAVLLMVVVTVACDRWVATSTRDRLYDRIEAIPPRALGLVLGTSERLGNGRRNLYFVARMQAAAALYHAGKVRHLLLSGDNHRVDYNEPEAMRQALLQAGVPDQAMTLDYAGLRTLDSIVRAAEVFGQTQLTVISQRFHNERALFIAERSGLDAIGFDAADVPALYGVKTRLREAVARLWAVLDVYLLQTRPRFIGPAVDITLKPAD